MHWVGVLRVSHVGRRDTESDSFRSIADQTQAIEHAIAARGHTVHLLPPELDVSGGLPLEQRPALYEAVLGVENGSYNGLVVAYLSRMGRDMRVLLEAWERIENAGGQVLAVREGIDTSTPAGRLHRNLLAAIDSNQREQASEAFEQQVKSATERGIWKSRQAPKGYSRDPDTRRLVPNADAQLVVQAFRDLAVNAPVVQVADRLGMTASGVRQMVKNRVYLGELRQRSYINLEAHPALVTEEEWQAAQSQRRARPARTDRTPALLAGLVRCQACGHTMSRTRGGGVKAENYSCHRRHSGGTCPSPAHVSLPLLNEHVESLVVPYFRKLAVAATDNTRLAAEARSELAAAEKELAAYLEATSALAGPAFTKGAVQRQKRVRDAEQQVASLQPVARTDWGSVAEAWGELDDHARNQLLRGFLEGVVVKRGRAPISERSRVVLHGAGVIRAYNRDGTPARFDAIEWLDSDDPRLLRANRS